MAGTLEDYKEAQGPLPTETKRWNLYGAGMDTLKEVETALPSYKSNELLVRHDAVGICASDIKIINQGPQHPKLLGRDFTTHPVVLGHEVSLTIVGVGADLKDQYQIGQRFIVQPDIFNHGISTAYGYRLDGGMTQYGVITQEALHGDDGNYLLPIQEDTGYVEAALIEPWACVVAAYEYPNYRDGLQDEGRLMIVYVRGAVYGDEVSPLYAPGHQPSTVTTVDNIADTDFTQVRLEETNDHGFDDIVVYGTPHAEDLGHIASCLGRRGILNLILDAPLTGKVPIDVGRIHYENQLYLSASDPAHAAKAYSTNTRKDLKPGGTAWFVGAGGPMGQMHVQRVVGLEQPPRRLIVTDRHADRLARIQDRFGQMLLDKGVELVLISAEKTDELAQYGPFDDIVCMVANVAVVEESLNHLAENGIYNLFAGLPKGARANLDLGTILAKGQRIIGTSGSSLGDIRHTLALVESDSLSTNASLAAIGSLDALRDGLEAVKSGLFPGKTVIFPLLSDLPLTSLAELKTTLPEVYARLQDGQFWTREAEEQLLREKLEHSEKGIIG